MATSKGSRQGLAIFISLAVSLGAIFLMFRQVDFDELATQLQDANPWYLIPTVATYPVAMLARTMRWKRLMEAPLDYWRAFHIINVGYLFNTILPFRLGEVTRIVLVSREPEQSMGAGVSATTVERLFDVIMALICVGLGLALIPDGGNLPEEAANGVGILILLSILGLGVILFAPPLHPFFLRLWQIILTPFPEGLRDKLYTFAADTLANLRIVANPTRLLEVIGWSMLTWTAYIGFFYISLYSFFDNNPPLSVGFLVTGFVAVGIAAPSLPGAIGVFQAAAILGLQTAGYDTSIATGYAWVLWICQTVVILIGGVVGLSALSLSFNQLSREVRETTTTS